MSDTLPPSHLDRAGLRLWREVLDTHELRPDEMRILEDACGEADMITLLVAITQSEHFDPYSEGSMGQQVINPVISELRQHRSTLATLLGKLKLTEAAGESAADVSNKARAAAQARWARVRPA